MENIEISTKNLGDLAAAAQKAGQAFETMGKRQAKAIELSTTQLGDLIRKYPHLERLLAPGQGAPKGPIVPPPIPPPIIGQPGQSAINWRMAGMSLLASPFSPWVGARGLSASGLFGTGGGGGGGFSSLFGTGGFGGFIAAFTALQVATHALRTAFESLITAVKEGARLYQRAARAGVATGKLSALEEALLSAGLPREHAEQLLLRQQYPGRGSRASMSLQGMELGAWRGLVPLGDLQQIKNMSKEIDAYWRSALNNASQMGNVAKQLQDTQAQISMLTREWRAMWQQIASLLSVAFQPIFTKLYVLFELINSQLHQMVTLAQFLGLISKDSSGQFKPSQLAVGASTAHMHTSAWERMGLVVGGFGTGADHAAQTAANTKSSATTLEHIESILDSAFGSGAAAAAGSAGGAIRNLP